MIGWAKGTKGIISRKKHTKSLDIDVLMKELEQGVYRFEHQLVPFYRGLAEHKLTNEQGLEIIKNMVNNDKVIAKKYEEHVINRWTKPVRAIDQQRNAWSLYNAFTDATTHVMAPNSLERSHEADTKVATAFHDLLVAV